MNHPLLLSSRNPDKIRELKDILAPLNISVHSMMDFPTLPETVEDQDTIFGNAMKKAIEGARHTGMLCLADDTGLFIDALNGDPGVYAARFAGENCSYQDNRLKVLLMMTGKSERSATFRTAIALADPNGVISVVTGEVRGQIATEERGDQGFGYDNIFVVEGQNRTYSEMDIESKNRISHRALATQEILPILKRILNINENDTM